jgi:phenylalanyl-tRNA synthetase beta chain
VVPGIELATHLVMDICGGTASEIVMAGEQPAAKANVEFPWSEVKRLTGLELETSEMASILEGLGFGVMRQAGNADRVFVQIPSWRPDVDGKADLVEEITRIAGLDRVTSTPLLREEATIGKPILTLLQKRTRQARRALAARGLIEAVTWSFVSKTRAVLFGGGAAELALANPIAADLSDMRPSLLPGLIAGVQRNADRGLGDAALFEVGQIFKGAGDKDQRIAAAAVRRGTAKPTGAGRHWSQRITPVDVFDVKADVLALLNTLGVATGGLQLVAGGPAWFHPGRSGTLQFGPKNIIGYFGEVHPRVLEELDVAGPVVAFEITLDDIPAPKAKPTKTKGKLEMSDFMPLERDFAFIVDRSVKAGDILRAAQGADKALISDATIFDIYEGTGIPDGKKSVAVSVTLQPREKTLTDADIEAVMAKIVAEVTKKTGATLRG